MANPAKRLPENVPGDFYVDDSCIDCDACRQIAPTVFRDHGEQSSVFHQPETDEEVRRALMSIVACRTDCMSTWLKSGYGSNPSADFGFDKTKVGDDVF